ncbi:tRNA pseudouridine(38-40) synthase TruA [Candidatus Bealeia paramacronuclearis]|uniref:tRNA pseudouridine synthase A n=1 Tax=Candidatus Bealeia paramacronuclearis TaxID=1921001 RepID=A0ABZ2C2M5_9PROT|nr:tRNA pseudouridine(38-40) synthase TruA [Candidatus Bealeia paramacronuclearis]
MPRYKLTIEYDGTPFLGWQRQPGRPTVQGLLEGAFESLFKIPTMIYGAGRTDTGVHATGQVAHVDSEKDYSPIAIQGAINRRVGPHPISITHVEKVSEDFHARFSATKRSYTFVILNRRAKPAIELNRVWWVPMPLDHERMHEAAQYLVGYHDFTSFRDTRCQSASPLKTVDFLNIERQGDHILLTTQSRSFLHHQVRNMAGTLKRVGDGSWEISKIKDILEAKDRRAAGPTAPPSGLYLTKIEY